MTEYWTKTENIQDVPEAFLEAVSKEVRKQTHAASKEMLKHTHACAH